METEARRRVITITIRSERTMDPRQRLKTSLASQPADGRGPEARLAGPMRVRKVTERSLALFLDPASQLRRHANVRLRHHRAPTTRVGSADPLSTERDGSKLGFHSDGNLLECM
ncbi:hypothetical protein EYF80_062794 [Liparis tanakae]|uniref:Uncharacterized protein n=1 Tax=Liparis tanakae TaxID=230148 RepID=A0A4Z2EEB2_9TELE|nr:hypothetical protein EYF80_062794 [Liparis tanakae]